MNPRHVQRRLIAVRQSIKNAAADGVNQFFFRPIAHGTAPSRSSPGPRLAGMPGSRNEMGTAGSFLYDHNIVLALTFAAQVRQNGTEWDFFEGSRSHSAMSGNEMIRGSAEPRMLVGSCWCIGCCVVNIDGFQAFRAPRIGRFNRLGVASNRSCGPTFRRGRLAALRRRMSGQCPVARTRLAPCVIICRIPILSNFETWPIGASPWHDSSEVTSVKNGGTELDIWFLRRMGSCAHHATGSGCLLCVMQKRPQANTFGDIAQSVSFCTNVDDAALA